jgi:hypothetical protein
MIEYPKFVSQAAHDYDCSVSVCERIFREYGAKDFYTGMENYLTEKANN